MKKVFCDWGTTNLRAYLIENNKVTDEYTTNEGLFTAKEIGFKKVLNKVLEYFEVSSDTQVKLSGMVGSKHGWKEAPYCETPVALEDLRDNFIGINALNNIEILGGVCHQMADGRYDVMRGEEVQIFGILSKYPDAKRICLPGTHSKWVNTSEGVLTNFTTWMTGDFFNCLSQNTIFKEQMSGQDFNEKGFKNGVYASKNAGPLLNSSFYLRTEYLYGQVKSDEFYSYLSGFLIGNEIKDAAKDYEKIYLSGSEIMMDYYEKALKCYGIDSVKIHSAEATILGMQSLTEELVWGTLIL